MKTVWDLISPVSLFMNSAVTNSGAEYVKSLSRHWSTVYFGGSNRWSRNDSDIAPAKSSIGLISSKISVRPEVCGISVLPVARTALTRACQSGPPSSQSKLAVCNASRSGAASGSRILANEARMRSGERGVTCDVLVAAKTVPSRGAMAKAQPGAVAIRPIRQLAGCGPGAKGNRRDRH